jgi:L-ribulose-5-phosphate 3-epimerase
VHRIGFMQGRLSPPVDGKIQAFPWGHWRAEFPAAQAIGFPLMEWTLDADRLYENPLMMESGRAEIDVLCGRHDVRIQSLTGDFFMQAPFHKANGAERDARLRDLRAVVGACAKAGIKYLVIPLVDDGRMENRDQEVDVCTTLTSMAGELRAARVSIIFESDYAPQALARFIGGFPADSFGVNYDIGNSAALGYDTDEEIAAYGARIVNVHVKDRMRGGTTVPLGTGNADLPRTFRALRAAGYVGDFILQTARAQDGDHPGALARYRELVEGWLDHHAA